MRLANRFCFLLLLGIGTLTLHAQEFGFKRCPITLPGRQSQELQPQPLRTGEIVLIPKSGGLFELLSCNIALKAQILFPSTLEENGPPIKATITSLNPGDCYLGQLRPRPIFYQCLPAPSASAGQCFVNSRVAPATPTYLASGESLLIGRPLLSSPRLLGCQTNLTSTVYPFESLSAGECFLIITPKQLFLYQCTLQN